jgi:hypothetical protein
MRGAAHQKTIGPALVKGSVLGLPIFWRTFWAMLRPSLQSDDTLVAAGGGRQGSLVMTILQRWSRLEGHYNERFACQSANTLPALLRL